MLVIIVTGIGISVTTLLLVLKRKKDYVVLSLFGMKEKMLRDLILYETFVISILGTIIGILLSFIITGFIEINIIKGMEISTLIKVSVFPLASAVLFIIVQTMIFTILPITVGKGIKPNSILRQEKERFRLKGEWSSSIFITILLMIISFSIYIGSIKSGTLNSCIILSLGMRKK